MEITEKVLKKENACTIIAESSTVLTDALKQKTKTTLLNLVSRSTGRRVQADRL